MSLSRRLWVELLGTFWLVLGGCGAAVISSRFPETGIGFAGIALAFGLALMSGLYALGGASGGHFNPAVTVGLATARRFPAHEVIPYTIAQIVGGIAAALVLYGVASGSPTFDIATNRLAANGFGAHSPGQYALWACALDELVMTFMFVVVILGSTDVLARKGAAPVAIGLCLTLIHLVSIPVTNTSVNPARSTGPAVVAGGWALEQLWLFWVAPLVGGLLAGVVYPLLMAEKASGSATTHGTGEGSGHPTEAARAL